MLPPALSLPEIVLTAVERSIQKSRFGTMLGPLLVIERRQLCQEGVLTDRTVEHSHGDPFRWGSPLPLSG